MTIVLAIDISITSQPLAQNLRRAEGSLSGRAQHSGFAARNRAHLERATTGPPTASGERRRRHSSKHHPRQKQPSLRAGSKQKHAVAAALPELIPNIIRRDGP